MVRWYLPGRSHSDRKRHKKVEWCSRMVSSRSERPLMGETERTDGVEGDMFHEFATINGGVRMSGWQESGGDGIFQEGTTVDGGRQEGRMV